MTKPTSILLMKRQALRHLSAEQKDLVRHVMGECICGLDEQNNTRWRRFLAQLLRAEPGEVFHLHQLTERSGPFHRMHMGFEDRLFKSQEKFTNARAFRNWLKTGAAWGSYELNAQGVMKFVPASISYEACSDAEIREVHADMLAFLRTPLAQRRLWPHLPAAKRAEMLESVLNDSEQQGEIHD